MTAPPVRALSCARRLLPSLTTLASVAFAAWMAHSFRTLYRVAVPPVPAVADVERDGLRPLWANASRLQLFVAMSAGDATAPGGGARRGHAAPATALFSRDGESSVALFTLGGREGAAFAYGAGFGAGLDLYLELELLQSDSAAADNAPPSGLRLVCARSSGHSSSASASFSGRSTCARAAAAWAKAHPPAAALAAGGEAAGAETGAGALALDEALASAASSAGAIARNGLLPSLMNSIGRLFVDDDVSEADWDADAEMDAVADARVAGAKGRSAATVGRLPRIVYESRAPAAARIARALAKGRPVSLHAAVAMSGVVPDSDVDPAQLSALAASERVSGAGGARFSRPYGPQLVERTSTLLVERAPYIPAPPLRYLWTDITGFGPAAAAFARVIGIEARDFGAARRRSEAAAAAAVATAGGVGGASSSTPAAAAAATAPAAGTSSPHWLGQLDVKLVLETAVLPRDEALLPPQLRGVLRRGIFADGRTPGYLPLLTANPVRPLRERYQPLNASARSLPLHVRFSAMSLGTLQLMRTLDASLSVQKDFGANDHDTDDVIRLVSETPLWLLGLTFVISAVHLLFDMLALKSDVSFWSSSTSLRGLSVRALAVDFASQLVVTLFLHSEGSSLLVIVPQALGNALGAWKLLRAFGVVWTLRWHVLPVPSFDARFAATASEAGTARHDAEALGNLAALLAPLLLGFAANQLLLAQHESWGKFALQTAVSVVYGAGFALMIPQVWLNYRMKSVAHLPWNVLGYRFVNTFIDDVFAFIVKMPTMARLAVFRDDLVFIVYLFQRWSYPVDRSRPAEGFEGEGDKEALSSLPAEK
jgi:hypothetical protein